jgi:hypothetical protein
MKEPSGRARSLASVIQLLSVAADFAIAAALL